LLGLYHVVLVIIFAYLLFELWPVPWPPPPKPVPTATPVATATNGQPAAPKTQPSETTTAAKDTKAPESKAAEDQKAAKIYPVELIGGIKFHASFDGRLILIVLIAGGLGAYVHAASSLADYVGNQKFATSWILWYLLRPFIGMSLALVLYVVVRAGFISVTAASSDINIYGIAAIAAMAGLFSKQAADKLNEVFTTAFRTAPGMGDDTRKHKLVSTGDATLRISGVEPPELKQSTPSPTLRITGAGFMEGVSCAFNGIERRTQYRSATELECILAGDDTAKVGVFDLTVKNPGPGGQSSSQKIEIKV
jgi:hypothetical protein